MHADCHQKGIKVGWQDQEDQLSCLSSDHGIASARTNCLIWQLKHVQLNCPVPI
jgi:hypothetical protein